MVTGARYIIGVGNADRGDDAVGRAVAGRLRDRVEAGVEILEDNGEVATLLAWLEQAQAAWCIDAAASGGMAGTIHRFDAHDAPLPQTLFSLSTHGFGLGEAVELARIMGTLPATCVIYAVEGTDFGAGRPLSEAVAGAVAEVAERLAAEVADHKRAQANA